MTASANDREVPVISLREAPGERAKWGRSLTTVLAWSVVEALVVTNQWQISSKLRVAALRAFGAQIEDGVIFRPRTRVKFPWKLKIGADSWIGEGVWIHNQDQVTIGRDVVISQDTFLTTGSHAHRRDMGLITRPILVADGAWVTSKCVVVGGVRIGRSALVTPLSVVTHAVEANAIVTGNPATAVGTRFKDFE